MPEVPDTYPTAATPNPHSSAKVIILLFAIGAALVLAPQLPRIPTHLRRAPLTRAAWSMSLDESLLRRQEELDRAEAWASEWTASPDSDEFGRYSADPENGWSRSWLPLLAGGGAWYHAVTVPTSGPVLMFIWEASDPIPPDDREMYPLETVIDSWVKAMPDAEWDPSIKGWRYLQESVPKPLLQY